MQLPQTNTHTECLTHTCTHRGEVLYGSSLWSSGHRGGYEDAGGFDDFAAGLLGISASEEAEGEAVRRAAVRCLSCLQDDVVVAG